MRLTLLFRALLLCLGVVLAASFAAQAQDAEIVPADAPADIAAQGGTALPGDVQDLDFEAWNIVAERAEAAVEAGRASDAAFEALRSQVAEWRARFLAAQNVNRSRIETIESQIAALGPAPEEGQEESEDVALRRAQLNEQLERLRAPVRAAEEAYNRANGLIGEIDALIRARQTDALFNLGPSPIVPDNWAQAWREVSEAWRTVAGEARSAWRSETRMAEFQRKLPTVLLLLALAVVLLLRGRTWAKSAGYWLRNKSRRGGAVFSFLVSVGQIALPLIGLMALVEAIFATGIPGVQMTLLLEPLPFWGLVILGVRWLADRLFSQHDGDRMLPMERRHRREGRTYTALLGVLIVLRDAIDVIADYEGFSDATLAVIDLPVVMLASLILFRLGQLMIRHIKFDSENSERAVRARIVGLLGRIAIVVAIVSPILSIAGYGVAATSLLFPAIMSLALWGFLLVLMRFINDLYRFVMNQSEEDADSLITVLISFMLALASLPVLGLIWGARVADLTEIWTKISEGFAIGDTRISPTDFMVLLVVFVVGYMATRLLQGALKNSILPRTRVDAGGQNAIVSGIGYVGIFLAALIAITSAGLDLSSLAIVAGALSVGIGFGLQNIVSNFVSGIILLIERPIAEGDWIEVGGIHGTVKRISVRSTRLETFDRYDVIIPNADFVSGRVSNYTRGNSIGRLIVPVGVAYGTDTRKVERILLNVARHHDMVLMSPEPAVIFQGFGADSLDFELRVILRDVNYTLSVRSEMNHQIAARFVEEGIEIPFAQRDIWIRNPETLAGAAPVQNDMADPSGEEDLENTDDHSTGEHATQEHPSEDRT